MPSTAYGTFKHNLVDVARLSEAYESLKPTGQGRRGLGHLTRSAIVTLCACWEQYAEDVIVEGAELIRNAANTPDDLPLRVRKVLSDKVRNAKHELKPLELAGEGWKDVYAAYARDDTGNLHSPKTAHIQTLMENYLGITDKVHEAWGGGMDAVDDFVGLRNSIAHKGRRMGRYIKFAEVDTSIKLMHTTVVETDNFVVDYLAVHLGMRPWNRRNL